MSDVERFLFRYNNLERTKKTLENDLIEATEEYQAQSESLLKPYKLSLAKSGKTNKVYSSVEESVIKIVDVYRSRMERIQMVLVDLDEKQQRIKDTVKMANLNTYEYSYIFMRYFKGYRSWQTAQKLQYSERQTNRFKLSALNKIKAILKDG